jgi:hypothetical protein
MDNKKFERLNTTEKIGVLLSLRKNMPWGHLATLLGCTPETIYNRREKNDWKAAELVILAKFFGIDKRDLI